MYSAIYDYAVQHGISLPKYRKEKQIKGYIRLSCAGEYEGFEKVPKDEVARVWCPHVADSKPSIICEKLQYIFPDENMTASVQSKHDGWLNIMKEGAEHSVTLCSIYQFLDQAEENKEFRDGIQQDIMNAGIKKADFLSFRIGSVNAERSEDWVDWFDQYAETHTPKKSHESTVVSELTGRPVVPIVDKFPQNNSKAAGTGFPIYSNQHRKVSGEACSFVSYGSVNGLACPMSSEEADAINAGLKKLLDSDTNNDRDFGFIYWYDSKDAMDLITRANARRRSSKKSTDDIEREREKLYQTVLKAVFGGVKVKDIDDVGKYHIVEYNLPDKGRVSLSREYFGTYKELYDALQQWYSDTSYTCPMWINGKNEGMVEYTIDNICAVLYQCLRHKNVTDLKKQSEIEFGPDKRNLLKAMLMGRRIPQAFLHNASEQLTRSYLCKAQFDGEKRSSRLLLQIIKASLLREGYKDMNGTLNRDAASIGYQCGRWFAAMVRIQELSAAGKKLNVTMAERYYRAAKKSPAQTFVMINDLKEHYLGKMTAGSRVAMEKLFAEIAGHIGTAFPEHLSILEQGAFDLGYAQQRQAFFERADAAEADSDQ